MAVGVAIKDVFDNAIPNYAGTVSFATTDTGSGAATPGVITFAGTEGGVGSGNATFVTPGPQTLSAIGTATDSPTALGNAVARVHGLVYTAPTTGRVRLVVNAAQSTPKVVQLDLVANERLLMSSLFTSGGLLGGPGSFAAGMNLPLDTTRVTGDTTLFTPGTALPAGDRDAGRGRGDRLRPRALHRGVAQARGRNADRLPGHRGPGRRGVLLGAAQARADRHGRSRCSTARSRWRCIARPCATSSAMTS